MSSCDEDSCSDGEWARLREAVSGAAPVQPTERGLQHQRKRLSKRTPTSGGECASEQVGTQTYLARKLAELLDSQYDTSAAVSPPDEINPGTTKPGTIHEGGIRLLSTSEQPIAVQEESNSTTVSRKPLPSSDSDDSEEERLLVAVVDPHTLTSSSQLKAGSAIPCLLTCKLGLPL